MDETQHMVEVTAPAILVKREHFRLKSKREIGRTKGWKAKMVMWINNLLDILLGPNIKP